MSLYQRAIIGGIFGIIFWGIIFAVVINEYLPNSDIFQSRENGYTTPSIWNSKEVITPEWCKKVTSSNIQSLFIPTRSGAEWGAFRASATAHNIDIWECTMFCGPLDFDGYHLGSGAENEINSSQKSIPHGSCSRGFQCSRSSQVWLPSSDPICTCDTGYIWNGSACVVKDQTITRTCVGSIPANATRTGPSSYTSYSYDGGASWSPLTLSWSPSDITFWVETFTNIGGRAWADQIGNSPISWDQYCREAWYASGTIIRSWNFYTASNNTIAWWGSGNWVVKWALSNNNFIEDITCSWTKGNISTSECSFTCNSGYVWNVATHSCNPLTKIFNDPNKKDLFADSDTIAGYSPATRIRWCQEKGYDKGKVLNVGQFYSCGNNHITYWDGTRWINAGACDVSYRADRIECTQWVKGYTWEWPFPGQFSINMGFYRDSDLSWTESVCGGYNFISCHDVIHNYTERCNAARCTDSAWNIVDDTYCTAPKPLAGTDCSCVWWTCPSP